MSCFSGMGTWLSFFSLKTVGNMNSLVVNFLDMSCFRHSLPWSGLRPITRYFSFGAKHVMPFVFCFIFQVFPVAIFSFVDPALNAGINKY